MRKLYFLIFMIFSIAICGCSEKSDDNQLDKNPIVLSPTELFFESPASSSTITITYEGEWTADGANEWCTVTPNHGYGDTDVIVSVTKNEIKAQRENIIMFIDKYNNETPLNIIQYELIKTNYKDISWTDDSSTYNEESGQITIVNGTGVEVGKVLVLPAEFNGDIRIVESVSKDGSNLTVTTSQGDMQDLFCDIDFALATSKSAEMKITRSPGKRIITPSKIYTRTDSGVEVIYDVSNSNTRSYDIDTKFGVRVESDFSGYRVFKNNNLDVSFEKAIFNSGLDFIFEFEFGEEPKSILDFKGELENMKAYLEGNLNMDYLAKCIVSGEYSYKNGYDEAICFEENILKDLIFKFMVGTVPVFITVSTDLCGLIDVNAKAQATVSSGFSFSANSQLGMEYNAITDDIQPICSFDSKFDSYPFTLSAYGTANMKVSLYPMFRIKFYDFIGPTIEPISYVELDLKAGMRASTDGNNYFGWQSEVNSGIKYRMGMTFDFLGLFEKSISTGVHEADKFYEKILKSPVSIRLSEDNKSKLNVGEVVDVTFNTMSYNNLTMKTTPCSSVFIVLESKGIVSDKIVVSDEDGIATVSWRPINTTQILNAKIVDKDGNTISDVTYAPEIIQKEDIYPYKYTNPNNGITYSVTYDNESEWIYAGLGTYSEAIALCPPDSWSLPTTDEVHNHVYYPYFKPPGVISIGSTYYTYWWSSTSGTVVYNKYQYSMGSSWGTTTIDTSEIGRIYFCREPAI